ncbi:hypothetical protein DFH09DRAFT_1353414 [Mycena vulgaris]|nr:hypothetical protein DFH09DRAFT_1353414 [Mycena vulgaris]
MLPSMGIHDSESSFPRSHLLPESPAMTRIRESLRSNSPPPNHLPSTMSTLSQEIACYEVEISRLRAQLKTVEADHATLLAQYSDCRGLLAPIRRLPSEILVEIFAAFCATSHTDAQTYSAALSRLAQAPLLALSQVCARWHALVMGTPKLWATIGLNSVLWRDPASTENMMTLLRAAIQRGNKCLLDIVIIDRTSERHVPGLELLAEQSERWRSAKFVCAAPDLQHLSIVKGRVPYLESLGVWGGSPLDIFDDAPSLTHVALGCTPTAVMRLVNLPLGQLRTFRCSEFVGLGELMGVGVSPAMTLMPQLSRKFTLLLRLLDSAAGFKESTLMPPITSDIDTFLIHVEDGFSANNVGLSVSKTMEGLTLPALRELELSSEEYPYLLLPWPHTQFLALCARSSFHTHFRSLQIYHSVLTEAELLECLSSLPLLEELAISDHQLLPNGGADQLLVTDTLLTRLTLTPDDPLVPHLQLFDCASLLKFDDHTKRDFGDAQDGDEGATAGNQADFAAAFDVDTDMEREIFGSDSYSDESDP